jgi:hypothetical protein
MPEVAQPEAAIETTASGAEAAPSADPQGQEPAPKPTETVEFWKGKAREQEKRAKENADKAQKFDQVTAAQKSELQLAIERAEAAEKKSAVLEAEKQKADWKAAVAKDPKYAGVPADVLRGESLEEIEAHAASLKALLPEPRKPGQVPGEGRTVTTGSGDPAQQFADILRKARGG